MAAVIAGTGVAVPPNVATNDALTRIMDTTDDWIVSRTGVRSRRFVDPGTGTSDLAAEAARAALADARADPSDVDAVVCATMTPDRQNPGIAGAVQHKAGLAGAAVFDLRQQCAGFLFGLDLADMLIATGRAVTVLVVGAEVHAGYLPWGDAEPSPLRWLDWVGAAVWAVGLTFESVGDEQLRRFTAGEASRGKVMDRGLWRYSRHPNYFGDSVVWWGIWVVAAAAGAWWTLVGPLVMTILLLRVSGVTLLERNMGKRRPGYAEYAARTSAFIPLPPRRTER